MNLLGALLIVVFGFLFVTVSSRLTGEIGSSSNPISGMTVATLLLTCLIFLRSAGPAPTYYVTALSVGAIVCIAASNGGTTSQDLKTGFLVGATPRNQQIAILVGALASALVLGPILLKLNDAATVYVPRVSKRAGRRRRRADAARRRELAGDAARRSGDADRHADATTARTTSSGTSTIAERRPGGQVPGRRRAARRSTSSIPASTARIDVRAGRQRRSTKFDAPKATLMSLHHQGHPQPPAAVGPGAARRDDRARARDVGHPVARLRGRRLPAALVVDARSSSAAWSAGWSIATCAQKLRAART